MDKVKLKKLLILNVPYILMGLFATNLGEAWRLAEDADTSAKLLSFFNTLPPALNNPLPSFYPLDLFYWHCLRCRTSPCSLSERKKCQKVSTQ